MAGGTPDQWRPGAVQRPRRLHGNARTSIRSGIDSNSRPHGPLKVRTGRHRPRPGRRRLASRCCYRHCCSSSPEAEPYSPVAPADTSNQPMGSFSSRHAVCYSARASLPHQLMPPQAPPWRQPCRYLWRNCSRCYRCLHAAALDINNFATTTALARQNWLLRMCACACLCVGERGVRVGATCFVILPAY